MIYNLTPHPITICDGDGNVIRTIPNCGWELRLGTTTEVVGTVDSITLTKTVFGEPTCIQGKSYTGQPNPWWDGKNKYIVSQLVKSAFEQNDPSMSNMLLVPAEVVRDREGNIIGCKSLGV